MACDEHYDCRECSEDWKRERERWQSDLNAALAQRTREIAEHRLIRLPDDPLSSCCCGWKPTSCDIAGEWKRHILALIKPDESAALDEHDRRVGEVVKEMKSRYSAFPHDSPVAWAYGWCAQAVEAALRGTGEEKQREEGNL